MFCRLSHTLSRTAHADQHNLCIQGLSTSMLWERSLHAQYISLPPIVGAFLMLFTLWANHQGNNPGTKQGFPWELVTVFLVIFFGIILLRVVNASAGVDAFG